MHNVKGGVFAKFQTPIGSKEQDPEPSAVEARGSVPRPMSVQGGAPRATPCSRPRDAVLSETGPPVLGRTLCYGDVTNQQQPNVRQNGQDGEVSEDELQRRQGWGSWEWVANAAPREGAGGGQGLWAGSRETRALLTPCSARARREDKGRPPARSRAGPEK